MLTSGDAKATTSAIHAAAAATCLHFHLTWLLNVLLEATCRLPAADGARLVVCHRGITCPCNFKFDSEPVAADRAFPAMAMVAAACRQRAVTG